MDTLYNSSLGGCFSIINSVWSTNNNTTGINVRYDIYVLVVPGSGGQDSAVESHKMVSCRCFAEYFLISGAIYPGTTYHHYSKISFTRCNFFINLKIVYILHSNFHEFIVTNSSGAKLFNVNYIQFVLNSTSFLEFIVRTSVLSTVLTDICFLKW